jgi:hypothetical protein
VGIVHVIEDFLLWGLLVGMLLLTMFGLPRRY